MHLILEIGLMNVIFHHGGQFVHDNFMFYMGGNKIIVHGQDPDRWIYFEVVSLVKYLGYDGFRLWKKIPGVSEGYFNFTNDKDAKEIATQCLPNNVDAHIWVKHDVEDMLSMVFVPNIFNLRQESEDSSSDGSDVDGIRFDNIEEERTTKRNEGYGEEERTTETIEGYV